MLFRSSDDPTQSESQETLSFSITALPDPAIGNLLLADGTAVTAGQTLTLQQLQNLSFQSLPNAYGNTSFSYSANDSNNNGVTSESFSISVLPVNDIPTQTSNPIQPLVVTGEDLVMVDGAYRTLPLSLNTLAFTAASATTDARERTVQDGA